MRKEAKLLLKKGIASLILSVEHFNRPSDLGRVSAVLIMLDHAFEMFLKAAILHRGGKIRQPHAKQTIGFDHCVRVALSDGDLHFLTEEDALLLQSINGLRDAAQHHTLDISEQHLYIQCQAGLSLFRRLLLTAFEIDLASELPSRVLPLCTAVPIDLSTLFESEVDEIRKLLRPGKRRRQEASDKLRALAIVEASLNGEHSQPSDSELAKFATSLDEGLNWEQIFPGVASINITATGSGPSIDLRISKKSGVPVVLVQEGTPDAAVVALKRVNELDFYNLGARGLAERLQLTVHQTLAVVEHLHLQKDSDAFKTITIGSQTHKRYSQTAIPRIQACVETSDLSGILDEYHRKRRKETHRRSEL